MARANTQPVVSGSVDTPTSLGKPTLLAQFSSSLTYSGPLPPPQILKGYEELVEGAANRLITLVENQNAHRIQLETKVTDHDIENSGKGRQAGFILGLVGLIGGCIVEVIVRNGAGAAIAGTSLVSLVGVFVYGTRSRKEERIEKAKIMVGHEPKKKK